MFQSEEMFYFLLLCSSESCLCVCVWNRLVFFSFFLFYIEEAIKRRGALFFVIIFSIFLLFSPFFGLFVGVVVNTEEFSFVVWVRTDQVKGENCLFEGDVPSRETSICRYRSVIQLGPFLFFLENSWRFWCFSF
jgi:hypothetical protein